MLGRGAREILEELRAERRAREAELARWREEDLRRHAHWREEDERWREEDLRRHERWRADFEAHRREWRAQVEADRLEQKRRFDALDTAMENDRRVTRDILLELREGREMLRDMRHGIQANTAGLLRVLDELHRGDGPSQASA